MAIVADDDKTRDDGALSLSPGMNLSEINEEGLPMIVKDINCHVKPALKSTFSEGQR
ncbi:hypothetical protein L2729_05955 [Shewanella gelidimarina]|uniref:hypothetical protein n=1 Tax=Shewanella gelidimarina TaxID=56813 RepID=UPI00200EF918|nr:hypothetical protein [Shewanella gelidimarina]MCL1057541.1 hypothetical protein [Shewanella gelidimarina]